MRLVLITFLLLFAQVGQAFEQATYFKASNTDSNDYFGTSVAISRDTMVVGAWGESSNAVGINGDQSNNSFDSSGAVYVFVRKDGVWTQQAYLKASNTGTDDRFGQAVAISGDTIVVGAFFEDSIATGVNGNQTIDHAEDSGAVYVFTRKEEVWSQQAYLKASNSEAGDRFGRSVDIDGDRIIVGSDWESSNATGVNGDQENNQAGFSGAAYIFKRTGEIWQQEAYLKASNTDPSDLFGMSVSISGERALIGAALEDSNATDVGGIDSDDSLENSGAAYVFSRKSGDWAQEAYLKASNTDPGDQFGTSVSIEGYSIVIGARGERSNASGVNGDQTNNLVGGAGAAYLFEYQDQEWKTAAYLKALNPAQDDQFGRSVSISDRGIVVGATFRGAGQGAAFIYSRRGGETGNPTILLADNGGYMDYFGDSVAIGETSVIVGAYLEDSSTKGINVPEDNFSTSSGAAYEFIDLRFFIDLIFKDSFE